MKKKKKSFDIDDVIDDIPETAFEQVNRWGTYNVQDLDDNDFPKISQH